MSNLNILVSGSGVAGSVFAFWLLRFLPSAQITVVERASSLCLTGTSVDIRSSAVDIIKWMGLEQEIHKHTAKEKGADFVREDETPVATSRATGRTDVQSCTSAFEIFRRMLATIFMDRVQDRVKLLLDESIESFEQTDDGVYVKFAKSQETRTFDLLVAADGLGARLRGLMLNSNSYDQIYHEGVHVACFATHGDRLQGKRLAKWYNATDGRVFISRPDSDPVGHTRTNLMNVTTAADVDVKDELNKAHREGSERNMKLMEDVLSDAGWVGPKVLQCMRKSDDFNYGLFGQVSPPKLHSGRIVLLGDAATPGFGTSLAVIGGYVLAGELLIHEGDLEATLQRYEELMLPFAQGSQGGPMAMQLIKPQPRWGIRIRNKVLDFITRRKLDQLAIIVAWGSVFRRKRPPCLTINGPLYRPEA